MTRPVVEAKGLTFAFGEQPQLMAVDLTVVPGQIYGLVGADGAGKTTLLRLCVGHLRPTAGTVRVLGQDPTITRPPLAYMPQGFGLYPDLSVAENLRLYADLHGLPTAAYPTRAGELLERTGLAGFEGRRAGALSGGMMQKLALACALISDPQVMFLDEPTTGVDPLARRGFWRLLEGVRASGVAILYTTANMDEAERCDQVGWLTGGRLVREGSPAELAQPGSQPLLRVSGTGVRNQRQALAALPGVELAFPVGTYLHLWIKGETDSRTITTQLTHQGLQVKPVEPGLQDVALRELARTSQRSPATQSSPLPSAPGLPSQNEPVIQAQALVRRFGTFTAVNDIAVTVQPGEVFGLLGANGAGKTTAIRLLCGLLPPTSGSIRLAGVDMVRYPRRARAQIGYVAQRFALYGELTVRENLELQAGLYGLTGRSARERVDQALSRMGLVELAHRLASGVPLGFQRRLSFAAALLHRPAILFLDEPTSGVDPLARQEFWELIYDLADEGIAILATTHYMDEATFCDRLSLMHAGRIVAEGSPLELANHPAAGQVAEVRTPHTAPWAAWLAHCPEVREIVPHAGRLHLSLTGDFAPLAARAAELVAAGQLPAGAVVPVAAELEDVFVAMLEKPLPTNSAIVQG